MRWLLPYKYKEIRRRYGERPFTVLDVGAGNHSASATKRWFPRCRYVGVDRDRGYNNDARDFAAMDGFFEVDLTTLDFEIIPDDAYDVILMAHVIEHLPNGEEVVRGLLPKLRSGGLIYLEFPGERSLRLPSKRGTLNFRDDPTHVRVYSARQVAGLLESLGVEVIRAGSRRDPLRALLTPLLALRAKLKYGYVPGGVFWDLLGFAEVVIGVKGRGVPPASDPLALPA